MKRHLLFFCFIVTACADNTSDNDLQKNQKVDVSNEALFENALTLDFSIKESVVSKKSQKVEFEILSDSRCPAALTCIWEGEVKAEITILDSQGSEIVVVLKPGDSKEVTIDNHHYLVKLVAVEPYPVDGPIDADDYRIVLEITPL